MASVALAWSDEEPLLRAVQTGSFLATLASHESGCTTPVLFTRQMWQLCLGVYQTSTLRLQSLLGVHEGRFTCRMLQHERSYTTSVAPRHCMFVDNGHTSHCTLLSVGQSFRTKDRSSSWLHAVHCQISVHVQTSDLLVMAPRNRKLALLLAVAVSAAPTLFI